MVDHTLTAVVGAFTVAGNAATVTVSHKATAVAGAFTVAGNAATVTVSHKATAVAGAYTIAGNAATVTVKHIATAVAGTYTIAGSPVTKVIGTTISQSLGTHQAERFGFGYSLAMGNLGLHDTVPTYAYRPGALVAETLRIAPTEVAQFKYAVTAADIVKIRAAISAAFSVTVTGGLGLASVLSVAQGLLISAQLGLADGLASKATYYQTLAQGLRFSDALARFFSGIIAETIGLTTVVLPTWRPGAVVAEVLGVADSLAPKLLLRVDLTETMRVTDAQVLKMIFAGTIAEGLQIAAAYVDPSGSFTTWAVNTRTAAVTEYQNYNFNSFARMGRKYLGANATGLYELQGNRDGTDNILARIKSGLGQFGGSKLTAFAAVYLGMRGKGDLIFKLVASDGREYVYKIKQQDMRTTKVNLGKGLRARYFAFELISTGPDFSLESVEFVPMVAKRRV